jgi:hypothetical protein
MDFATLPNPTEAKPHDQPRDPETSSLKAFYAPLVRRNRIPRRRQNVRWWTNSPDQRDGMTTRRDEYPPQGSRFRDDVVESGNI